MIVYDIERRWQFHTMGSNSNTENSESSIWTTGIDEITSQNYDNMKDNCVSNVVLDFWSCHRSSADIKTLKEEAIVSLKGMTATYKTNCNNQDDKSLQSKETEL
ncbi:PREDICTED: uncharacterized protein LOC105359732 [Ceratosolen solmsi marchali]|uniref:Uncharacterized protein LOC105359732 n=1 Tax=Ceratosolen solmsi marchali TaxID=326594 RepID=A0AAJ6VMH8_9HYME|nr:PREDICTED: uncharacterized protein LOC105359732 [Ceratosolen solmsi marchali]